MDLCDAITGWEAIDGALIAAGSLIEELVRGYEWVILLGAGVPFVLVLGAIIGGAFVDRLISGRCKILALVMLILTIFLAALLGNGAGLSYAGWACH
jgi:MFS family permease